LDFRFWILEWPYSSRLTPYRITLSALAKTLGGMINPICFAVLRLMMNSNFCRLLYRQVCGLSNTLNYWNVSTLERLDPLICPLLA
jgi:hypothetical protein